MLSLLHRQGSQPTNSNLRPIHAHCLCPWQTLLMDSNAFLLLYYGHRQALLINHQWPFLIIHPCLKTNIPYLWVRLSHFLWLSPFLAPVQSRFRSLHSKGPKLAKVTGDLSDVKTFSPPRPQMLDMFLLPSSPELTLSPRSSLRDSLSKP